MIRSFVEKILEMAPVQRIQEGDRVFTDKKIIPVFEPEVEKIGCHTLTGLIDFYNALDLDDRNRAMFLVDDFDRVSIVSEIFGVEKQREVFITAKAYDQEKPFNRYYNNEDFMIKVMSCFVQDETTEKVLRIIGNLKVEAGLQVTDDGLSQQVTAKTGITKVENIELPNPIVLRPYRTFMDIEQPDSAFILRLKQADGVSCALFEADGCAWKNDAIARIKGFIGQNLHDVQVIA